MDNCIYCKVIKGELPSFKVYEDKEFLAFLDIYPHALGHTLIIPKKHVSNILELNDNEAKSLIVVIRKVMHLIEDKLEPDGFNVGWNHNSAGGQAIPHLHVHIFPRYQNDGGGNVHSIIKNPGDRSVEEIAKLFKS